MWPLIIGGGAIALLAKALFDDEETTEIKRKIFISFAIEDKKYRDHLVKQSRLDKSPFVLTDMSVKEPYLLEWKRRCRTKIKRCDGMIVLLSKNTWSSSGVRWEIKCAREEAIPVIGMHIKKNDRGAIPPELKGKKIIEWTWDNLEKAIDKM